LQAVKNLSVEAHGTMEKKWTAFLRLKGKTRANNTEGVVEQFDGLFQSLVGVDIDCSIIVFVEDKDSRVHRPPNGVQHPETTVPSERSDA
jgi:hypothetical protein